MTAAAPLLRSTWRTIGIGQSGALDALHRMRGIVQTQCAEPHVRELAEVIARDTGTNTPVQIALIRHWLARHIGFLRDPLGIEYLVPPVDLLAKLGVQGFVAGDCDDVAMLGATLGMAIGLRARFCMIGEAEHYEHVWAELADPNGGEWSELDITRPWQADFSRFTLTLAIEV